MATITNGNTGTRRDYILGNIRAVQVTSNVTTGDVYAPGLRILESMDLMMAGADNAVTWGATLSGGQATITLTGGPLTGAVLTAYGF